MLAQKLYRGCFLTIMMLNSVLYGVRGVDSLNSTIDFPHDQSYINTSQPTIIGTLRDTKGDPVTNETVQVLINGTVVGTTISDENGIFRLLLELGLSDGQYQLSVFCVETQLVVESNQFNVDTTAPSIVIAYPQEGDVVTTSTVTISGTTEENAMILTFLDADTFGNICYADESGNWSIDYEIDNGDHTIAAQATDIAGNQGDMSGITNFSVNA